MPRSKAIISAVAAVLGAGSATVATAQQSTSPAAPAEPVLEEMSSAALYDGDGLVRMDERQFTVTDRGRPFVRSIASAFDEYLTVGLGRNSVGV